MAKPDDELCGEALVRRLWALFDARKFDDVRPLLADDFIAEWPGTREIIRGPENFIALNKAYPGSWRCRLLKLTEAGEEIISEVEISDCGTTVLAVSFFTIADGKIARAREYFSDIAKPPFDRREWAGNY